MVQWLYQLGIHLMRMFLKIHALFNKKSALAISGRKNLFPQLEAALAHNQKSVIWFHCASLGEFEQGRPLIEYFKANHDYFILLTFFSPSGYEVRKNYEHADYITYMPFDTASNAKQFVSIAKPTMAFFIKYEFWHFYLKVLEQADCWIFSISTILRSQQPYFKWYGGFNRNMLKRVDHFFVQNDTTQTLLKTINIHNTTVTGDTRLDRVYEIAQNAKKIELVEQFTKGGNLLIGGSTWEPDIKTIAPFLQKNTSWKAVIAPHDISEASLKMHEQILVIQTERFSEIENQVKSETRAIIIDNIGMLTSLYQYGTVAFIGGAFGDGLHNTLEAACYALPIYFGNKKFSKFQEAKDLLKIDAAQSVADADDFAQKIRQKIEENQLAAMGRRGETYVKENLGATAKIIRHIEPIIQKMTYEG